ncbi:30S ribosomal protein S16 [Candidatus Carsonella ruddii]|uniref:30S ribosomal protein S16 n=1 Tax=Candidatus Carsonella ruddii PC isolate NHV TaxID=1202540 RepID=J3VQX5_CARRU|nr:30S ribosomal protein S16 [Candidatus Carsonella ruddii]AFP84351.1 ribosomal protein S16 [Candidatus Carsonella ruddii PC isolate NHV]
MIVIRLSKKIKKFFYINVIYKKKSVKGKIIKRVGYYNPHISYGKKYFLNFKLINDYIKNGAKISKKIFFIIKI